MVKYADSPTTHVEVHIDAPPAAVWPILCDVNMPAAFSEEFQKGEWIDDGAALGATFRGYNKHDLVGEWNVVCTITDFEPEQTFEWSVGLDQDRAARWRYDLSPGSPGSPGSADGSGSTLRFSAEMGPGPSGLTPAIEAMPDREEDIVAVRLEEWRGNMILTTNGIKSLAEGGDG